jgi:hypothetical protein
VAEMMALTMKAAQKVHSSPRNVASTPGDPAESTPVEKQPEVPTKSPTHRAWLPSGST